MPFWALARTMHDADPAPAPPCPPDPQLVTAPALAFLIPVNALRNAALLAASTPLVAMVDADLTIVDTLAQLLRDKRR